MEPPVRGGGVSGFFKDIFNPSSQFTPEEMDTFKPERVFSLRNRLDLYQADPSRLSAEEKQQLLADLKAEKESFNSITSRFASSGNEDTATDDFGDAFLNTITRFSGDVKAAFGSFDDQKAAAIRGALPDRTTDLSPVAGTLGSVAGEVLPSALALGAAVIPGGQVPAAIVGSTLFGTRAFGAERGEFRQERGIADDAPLSAEESVAGAGMAAIEGGAELLQLGFLTRLGSKAATAIGRAGTGVVGRGVAEGVGRVAANVIQAPLSEAVEEGATSIAQGAFQEFALGERGSFVEGLKESIPAAGQGGIGGALLIPVATLVGGVNNRRVSRKITESFGGDFYVANNQNTNQHTAPLTSNQNVQFNNGDRVGVNISLAEGSSGGNDTRFHFDVFSNGRLARTGEINASALRDGSYLTVFGLSRDPSVNAPASTAPAPTQTTASVPSPEFTATFNEHFGDDAEEDLAGIVQEIASRFDYQFGDGAEADLQDIVRRLSKEDGESITQALQEMQAERLSDSEEVDDLLRRSDALLVALNALRPKKDVDAEIPIVQETSEGFQDIAAPTFSSLDETRAWVSANSNTRYQYEIKHTQTAKGKADVYQVLAKPLAEGESGNAPAPVATTETPPVSEAGESVRVAQAEQQVAASDDETTEDRTELAEIDPNQTDIESLVAQNYGRVEEEPLTMEQAKQLATDPDVEYAIMPIGGDKFILLGRSKETIDPANDAAAQATPTSEVVVAEGDEQPSEQPIEEQEAPVETSRKVTIRVDGKNQTTELSGETLTTYNQEVADHIARVDNIERSGWDIDTKKKMLRGESMRHAAKKREITGLLTTKEADKKAKNESVVFRNGTPVTVSGRKGVVDKNIFGKIRVKFDDNGDKMTFERDKVKPITKKGRNFRASLGATSENLDQDVEFDVDEVLPITPSELRAAREGRGATNQASDTREFKFPVDENGNVDFSAAPDNIKSPRDHEKLKDRLKRLALRGLNGRFWYEDSSQRVLDLVGGNREDAEKFVQLIAIYSPRNPVPENWVDAVQAWSQYKAAQRRGTRPPIRAGMTRSADRAAHAVLFDNQSWSGRKTNSFYINMMRIIDPSIGKSMVVTVDRWIMRAIGYDTEAPSARQYAYSEALIQEAANEIGWEPQQVQAGIWVSQKHIADQFSSIGQKARTRALKKLMDDGVITERMLEVEELLMGKRPRTPREIFKAFSVDTNTIDPAIIEKAISTAVTEIAREQGVSLNVDDVKSISFADVANSNMAQLSVEATPTNVATLMPGIFEASYEEKLEYSVAVWNALSDANGRNEVFEMFGLLADSDPLLASGFWKGHFNPSLQFQAQLVKRQGSREGSNPNINKFDVEPGNKQAVEAAMSILGLLFKQDAVAYHRPVYVNNLKDANAVEFRMDRPMSRDEMARVYDSMQAQFGLFDADNADSIPIIPTPSGFRLINFGAFPNNVDFQKFVKSAVQGVMGSQVTEAVAFASDGDLISNNWRRFKNAEGYISRARLRGRPDLLGRVFGSLSKRVAQVNRRFAQEKGWGNPEVFAAHERAAEQIEQGAPITEALLAQLFINNPNQLDSSSEKQVGEHRLRTVAAEPGSTFTTETRLQRALAKGDRNSVRSVLGTNSIVKILNENSFVVSAPQNTEASIRNAAQDLGLVVTQEMPRDGYTAITIETTPEFNDVANGVNADFGSKGKDSNLDLVFYGNERGRTDLDPNTDGSTRTVPVIYMYRGGTKTEKTVTQVAATKYVAEGVAGTVYDIAVDPDKIVERVKEANEGVYDEEKVLAAIKEAGYAGFFNSRSGLPNVVGMFNGVQVTEHPITETDIQGEALVPKERPKVVREGDFSSNETHEGWSFSQGVYSNDVFPGYSIRFVDGQYQAFAPDGEIVRITDSEYTALAAAEADYAEKKFGVKDDGKTPHMTQLVTKLFNTLFGKSPNASNVIIVDNYDGLPQDAKEFAERNGYAPEQIHALTAADGTVYLVAENMPRNPYAMARVMVHELVGHYGVREVLGGGFNETLDSLYSNLDQLIKDGIITKEEVDVIKSRYKLDTNTIEGQRILMEEIIAHVAETDSNPSFLESIYEKIRAFLSELFGFDVPMDATALRKILADSRRFVNNPVPRYGSVNDNAYGHEKDNGVALAIAERDMDNLLGKDKAEQARRRIINFIKQGRPFDEAVAGLTGRAKDAGLLFAKTYTRELNFAKAPLPSDGSAADYVDYAASLSIPATRQLREQRVQGMVERMGNNVGMYQSMLLKTTNQELKRLAKKYPDSRIQELKDELFVDPTARNVSVGYQQNVEIETAKVMQEAGKIIHSIYGSGGIGSIIRKNAIKKDTARLTEIIKGDAPQPGEARLATAAGQVRVMLDKFRDYLVASGVIEPNQYIENYFPRIYDSVELAKPKKEAAFKSKMQDIFYNKDFDKFVNDNGRQPTRLEQDGLESSAREKALNLWEMIVLGDDSTVELIEREGMTHSGARTLTHATARTLSDVPDVELQEFLVQDPADVLTRYFRAGVRTAEYVRRFGKKSERANDMITDLRNHMIEDGAPAQFIDATIGRVKSILEAYQGVYDFEKVHNMAGGLKKSISFFRVLMGMKLLGLASINAMIEFAAPGVRTGIRSASKGLVLGLGTYINNAFGNRNDRQRFLEGLGVIGEQGVLGVINSRFFNFTEDQHTSFGQTVSRWFYKINLLEPITRLQRTIAGAAAQDLVGRIASIPTAKLKGRIKREAERLNLFVDHAGFSAWHQSYKNAPNDPTILNSPYYEMYRQAVFLVVTQTIVEPKVGNQPLFASSRSPWKRAAAQLQGFAFAFSDGPVSFIWDEIKESRGFQIPRIAALLVPTALMTVLAMSIREALSYDTTDDDDRRFKRMQDDEPSFLKAFEFIDKTGYLTPQYSRPLNTLFSSRYGSEAIVGGIFGPFAGQALKFLSATGELAVEGNAKPLEKEFKSMVPFASQSRPVRRELGLEVDLRDR